MTRRYYESEHVPVEELVPGNEVLARRAVVSVTREAAQMSVTFSDGTTATYDLTRHPSVEIVTAGLK